MIHPQKERPGLWSLSEAAKYGFALPHWWLAIQVVKALFRGQPIASVSFSAAWFLVAIVIAPAICVLAAMALNHYVRKGETWARRDDDASSPVSLTWCRKDRTRASRRKRLAAG